MKTTKSILTGILCSTLFTVIMVTAARADSLFVDEQQMPYMINDRCIEALQSVRDNIRVNYSWAREQCDIETDTEQYEVCKNIVRTWRKIVSQQSIDNYHLCRDGA